MLDRLFSEWCDIAMPNEGWEYVAHRERGCIAAVAALSGTEIHFAVNPSFRRRLILRERTRSFLAPLLERRGFLSTRSLEDQSGDFLRRLGFVETWTDGPVHHYMLTEMPFGKGEASCL